MVLQIISRQDFKSKQTREFDNVGFKSMLAESSVPNFSNRKIVCKLSHKILKLFESNLILIQVNYL